MQNPYEFKFRETWIDRFLAQGGFLLLTKILDKIVQAETDYKDDLTSKTLKELLTIIKIFVEAAICADMTEKEFEERNKTAMSEYQDKQAKESTTTTANSTTSTSTGTGTKPS